MTESADRYCVVANYQHGTASVSDGSKVFVLWMPGDGESVEVIVRSRGGRTIQHWAKIKDLGNFRIKTIVEGGCHPAVWQWASRTRAGAEADLARCRASRDVVRVIDRDLGDEDRVP